MRFLVVFATVAGASFLGAVAYNQLASPVSPHRVAKQLGASIVTGAIAGGLVTFAFK